MSGPFRYQNLGAFRLALALLVVISHTHALYGPPEVEQLLGRLQLGNIGVTAFFVVSGYIIASACDQLYSNRVGAFLANRFLRIYPPFLFALVASFCVHAYLNLHEFASFGHNNPAEFSHSALSLKTFVRNLFSIFDRRVAAGLNGYYLFVPYVWAIVIEVQFYIVAAMVFYASWRSGRHAAWALRASAVVLTAICLASLFVWQWPPQLLGFGPFFLFGCIWYYWIRNRSAAGTHRYWAQVGVVISLALTVTSYWLYVTRSPGQGALESTAGFAASILLLCWLTVTRPLALRMRRMDAYLGDLSYPVYLNHYVIEISFGYLQGSKSWMSLLGAISLTLLLSVVAAMVVEAATRRARDRFRGQALVR